MSQMSSDAGSAVCKEIAIPGLAVGKNALMRIQCKEIAIPGLAVGKNALMRIQ